MRFSEQRDICPKQGLAALRRQALSLVDIQIDDETQQRRTAWLRCENSHFPRFDLATDRLRRIGPNASRLAPKAGLVIRDQPRAQNHKL